VNKGIVWAVVAGLASLALVIGGCGGGDDETTSLTRAEFVKQGNEICKKQEERRSKLIYKVAEEAGSDPNKPLPTSARKALVLETLPPYEEMAEELDALGAPEGDEEKVEALVKEMEKTAQAIKADPLTAVSSTIQFTKANELAEENGLPECTL
jgi:hypothetical protein